MMTHLGLFEGIGGFSLAARWMGWETLAWCEWNEFGQRVLRHHFPNAEGFGDITKTDFTKYANRIDILTGGFPCQPYSMAGKRLGKEDDRHLWPEMLRAIREIQPTWVVGENVLGLVNWNGGLVFNEVQADLEAEGYEVQPYVLPACAVNAPHRRDRVWFVAYSNKCTTRPSRTSSGTFGEGSGNNDEPKERGKQTEQHFGHGNVYGINSDTCSSRLEANNSLRKSKEQIHFTGNDSKELFTDPGLQRQTERQKQTMGVDELSQKWNATDTDNTRFQTFNNEKSVMGKADQSKTFGGNGFESIYPGTRWENFPTQSPVCGGNDGLPDRLDGITFSKWRNESIKAGGNAIVPQVVFQIFKAIEQYEQS
jgi:DNA (cytosine-5)-methyltransferase 1